MKPEHARKLGRLFVGGPASFEAYKNAKDPEAARAALDKIVRDNEPFIAATVRDLKARGLSTPFCSVVEISDDDLLQAGRIGYAEAVANFDPLKGALPKYAKDWIRSKVLRAAASEATIHRPEQTRIPASAIRAAEVIEALTGREATAEEMGIPPEKLAAWKNLPRVVGPFRDSAHGIDLTEAAVCEDPSPEELLVLKELAAVVEGLPEKQREVISLIHWEGMSVPEVADELTIPEEAVLDLRDEALAELHAALS